MQFAGSALVGESMARPPAYLQNNVGGTISLLESMLSVGVNRIVFSSSCATYGMPKQIPIPEDHSRTPVNPYGESKFFAEKMLEWMGKAGHLRWAALRYFNARGAYPQGGVGEGHNPEKPLDPSAVSWALGQAQ